jgi:hypothetical protein
MRARVARAQFNFVLAEILGVGLDARLVVRSNRFGHRALEEVEDGREADDVDGRVQTVKNIKVGRDRRRLGN